MIAPSWVGDLIMSGPLIEALAQEGPVDLFLPEFLAPLGQRLPGVAEILLSPFGHGSLALFKRYQQAKRMKGRYQRAYVLPNSFKSALIPWFAGIPERFGFRGEMRYGLINRMQTLDKAAYPRLVDRYRALRSAPSTPLPRLLTQPIDVLRERLALNTQHPVLILCPGAEYGPAKQWPLPAFGKLAERASQLGFTVWVMGGAKDRLAGQTLAYAVPGVQNLAGKTSLAEAADLLHVADMVVTNDSGLMHVAAAVGAPLVALFGSSSPDYTPPLSPRAAILTKHLACSPCFERTCPLGHTDCLHTISVDEVMSAWRGLTGLQRLR